MERAVGLRLRYNCSLRELDNLLLFLIIDAVSFLNLWLDGTFRLVLIML